MTGSKTEQGVASALFSENFQISKRLPNGTSVLTAESYGVVEAINYGATVPAENILIVTDSRCSIQAIKKLYPTNSMVQKFQNNLRDSEKSFTLLNTQSHTNP